MLGIKRPPGFSGPPLNRAKLLTVAMKDLVSDAPRATTAMTSEPQGPGNPSVVKLKGIPSSMTAASVYDCLQQPLGDEDSIDVGDVDCRVEYRLSIVRLYEIRFNASRLFQFLVLVLRD